MKMKSKTATTQVMKAIIKTSATERNVEKNNLTQSSAVIFI